MGASSAKLDLNLDDLLNGTSFATTSQPPAPLVVNTSNSPTEDLVIEAVPLDPSDIAELISLGPSRSYATVQHTRAYHHIAALKLAAGEKAGVVAAALNLQPQTISRLLANDQFKELVENYRDQFIKKAVSTYELMQLVSMEAVSAIHEKLIGEERDSIPLEALRRIGETFADRTGYSPIRRSESLNVNASGSISDIGLERVKQRHGEDAIYRGAPDQGAALEEAHKEEALRIGAKASISEIFKPVETIEVEFSSSEGKSV